MTAAKRYFRRRGFDVIDVSASRSYELLCRHGARELHVEVEGTTTEGDAIVLTKASSINKIYNSELVT
jgi:hypothetical protein